MPELVWEGKYDENGKRAIPMRLALPFQTVETVNESAQQRQQALDFFADDRQGDWRNRLIWGDNKYVLPALLDDLAGQVKLIYIDPPFATGQDFSFRARVGDDEFVKAPSVIEQKAYRDMWGRGIDSYLAMMYERLAIMHQLLADDGALYLHCAPNVSHSLKLVCDEIFGEGLASEIIWKRVGGHGDAKKWSPVHDVILFFPKSETFVWNTPREPLSDNYSTAKYGSDDHDGRGPYQLTSLISPNPRPNLTYEWQGFSPPANGWRYSLATMTEMDREGRIFKPDDRAKRPRLKRYLNENEGHLVDDVWSDIPPVNSQAFERTGYDTQKPLALLERVISTSTNPGDLVMDAFCGSGTTVVEAERSGRRWIGVDLGRFAVHTARKRLLSTPDVQPFVVQNLGKYERQLWQSAEFGESAASRTASYRQFILDLYNARPIAGYTWIHGLKGGRMVHVGTVDAPVTVGDIAQIVTEFRKAVGTGKDAPTKQSVDVLGWDFAFEVNEVARQNAQRAGIDLRLVRIPREILEKRAVEQGDIKFFELAALSVAVKQTAKRVSLTIEDFVIPLDDVPADVQKAVTHWSQWIDYWAIDWDNKSDTFHNEWQSYRTRKDSSLDLSTSHEYDVPGEYAVVVKVIDILGNDTTKTINVKAEGRGAKGA